jgi:hypothetical protein
MSLIDYIRLAKSFPQHPKTRILKKIAGKDGAWALICLWCYAGEYAPDGYLPKNPLLLATIGEWENDPQALIDALITAGFLDDNGDRYYLHDWQNFQTWVVNREARVAAAKKAIQTRWSKEKRDQMPSQYNPNTQRIRPEYEPNTERIPNEYEPNTERIPNEYEPNTERIPNEYEPNTERIPNEYEPNTERIPNEYEPNTPGHTIPEPEPYHTSPNHDLAPGPDPIPGDNSEAPERKRERKEKGKLTDRVGSKGKDRVKEGMETIGEGKPLEGRGTLNEPANAGLSSSGSNEPSDDDIAFSLSVSVNNNTGRAPEQEELRDSGNSADKGEGKDQEESRETEERLKDASSVIKTRAGGGGEAQAQVGDSLLPDIPLPSDTKASDEGRKKGKGEQPKAEKKPPNPNLATQVVEIYHEVLPDLPKVRVVNDQLRTYIKARTPEIQKALKVEDPLQAWRVYFGIVKECPFLLGDSNTTFKADLHWLARPTNCAKVLNGRYLQDKDIDEVIEELTGGGGKEDGEAGSEIAEGKGGVSKAKPIVDETFTKQLEDFGYYLSRWYYRTRDYRDASIDEGILVHMMSSDPALKMAFERWGGWEKAMEVCRAESVIDESPVPRVVKELWALYREARLEIERARLPDEPEVDPKIIKLEVKNVS